MSAASQNSMGDPWRITPLSGQVLRRRLESRPKQGAWLIILVVVASSLVGAVSATNPVAGLAAAIAAISASSVLVAPWLVLIAVLPGSFLSYRLGGVGTGLSIADGLLIAAVLVAFMVAPLRRDELTRHLVLTASYFLLLLVPVVAHPTSRAIVEWGHRLLLVFGGLVVGAALAGTGQFRRALRAFVLAAMVIAMIAIVETSLNGFKPAYPIGLAKNQSGGLFAMSLILVVAYPELLWKSRAMRIASAAVVGLGILANQSRGAMLAAFVGVVYLWISGGLRRDIRRLIIPVALVLVAFVVISLETESATDRDRVGAVSTRVEFFHRAYEDWLIEPVLGQGLRYYLDPKVNFPRPLTDENPQGAEPHPHSIVMETLSESGLFGAVALMLLLAGTLVTLRQHRTPLALVAGAALMMSFGHSLVDIYWVAGLLTVPWMLIGMSAVVEASEVPQLSGKQT